ncbi:TPA: uracil-DNA glycosylase family protein [Vibrio harveyi]|uniref:uracil-DNA glycosylase family protein n=1 Tax=Vibrio harveyi TaxID=669 RepID=UPI003908EFDD
MSCHLQKGTENKVAFVFSCPGKHEKDAGYPAAKATGTNLEAMLEKLSVSLQRKDLTRKKITITNAWDRVEFEVGDGNTGRSEASDAEVVDKNNIQRLNAELRNISDFIFCCGDKAVLAVSKCKLKERVKVIPIRHLGNKAINSIKTDVSGNSIFSAEKAMGNGDKRSKNRIGKDNTSKRLDVICFQILEKLKI